MESIFLILSSVFSKGDFWLGFGATAVGGIYLYRKSLKSIISYGARGFAIGASTQNIKLYREKYLSINDQIADINKTIEIINRAEVELDKFQETDFEMLNELQAEISKLAADINSINGLKFVTKLKSLFDSGQKAVLEATKNKTKESQDTEFDVEEKSDPDHDADLGHQKGITSVEFLLNFVPALMALAFTTLVCYLAIIHAEDKTYEIPKYISTILTSILGFYFGRGVEKSVSGS